jgi:hypothetical protein
VVPGMPAYQTLTNQLNGLPAMPPTERAKLIIGRQVLMLRLQK